MKENGRLKYALISGINGRMGKLVKEIIEQISDMKTVAGFDQDSGMEGNIPIFSNIMQMPNSCKPNIIIDFSSDMATLEMLKYAVIKKIPIVIGTTQLPKVTMEKIQLASQEIQIFQMPNMSYKINALIPLLQTLATQMDGDVDIEIYEKHHSRKKDSPSGTALMLFDKINEALGGKKELVYGRTDRRNENEIGISSIRGGNMAGDHTIGFYGKYDSIEITHHVEDPKVFAEGAVKAALFLMKQVPGVYHMNDLLK